MEARAGMASVVMASPLGLLTLFEDAGALVAVTWGEASTGAKPADRSGSPLLKCAITALQEYFDGRPLPADVPLRPSGTPYQLGAWREIAAIPFGTTASYSDLAHRLDSGPRAVARACASNPLPIFIPCHRVVARGGGLGGYSGGNGLATKRALLALEASAGEDLSFRRPALSPRR